MLKVAAPNELGRIGPEKPDDGLRSWCRSKSGRHPFASRIRSSCKSDRVAFGIEFDGQAVRVAKSAFVAVSELVHADVVTPGRQLAANGLRYAALDREYVWFHETDARGGDRLLDRSEEHTSELQSRQYLVCRLLLEKKKKQ